MTLLIDTPRWPWRGRLWAHLISDESLDELHAGAEALGLRYVSFGRDHYDVPDHRWLEARTRATLVDSRVIVRSLRSAGLRVGGGKPAKTWRPIGALPEAVTSTSIDEWLGAVRDRLEDPIIEVLTRPTEHVVLHLLRHDQRPRLGDLAAGPLARHTSVRETIADGRYSIELILRS